jgi:PAS domain S-box-containing protein
MIYSIIAFDYNSIRVLELAEVTMRANKGPAKKAGEIDLEPESVFRRLAEYSPNMVFIIQNNKPVYVNLKFEELMEHQRVEVYSSQFEFLSLVSPEHREIFTASCTKQLADGEAGPVDCTLLSKNGRRIESIINFTHINYLGEPAIAGIITDVTALKRSEQSLAKTKEDLEVRVKARTAELVKTNEELQLKAAILDKATDAILLRGLDNLLVYANDTACRLYGYSMDEFIGMHLRTLFSPKETPYYEERQQTVRGEGELTVEGFHVRKDKSEIPVEVHSHLINIGNREYILSVIRDITKRKQIEQSLRESEMQFQKLFDAMSEGVVLLNPEGKIIKANIAEAKMMGLKSPEEIEGRFVVNPNIKRIYSDGTPVPPETTAAQMVFKSKRHVQDMVFGHVREGGSVRWYSINAVPVLDPSGNVTGIVRTMTDVTEQKQLRDEKEQFTRRLISVQEEERKRVARELHDDTAQNLALLMLEIDTLLNSKESLPAKILDNLRKLKEDTERTQREVRRYSHELRPGVLEHLGLEAALESLMEDSNSRGGTITTFNIEGEGIRLPEQMELALFRIAQEAVNNFLKHADATHAEINLKYTQKKIRLTIADNGKGFKPVRKNIPGTTGGLGLIGMQERAQLIGANLRIKSNPGKGTVVLVEAPIIA